MEVTERRIPRTARRISSARLRDIGRKERGASTEAKDEVVRGLEPDWVRVTAGISRGGRGGTGGRAERTALAEEAWVGLAIFDGPASAAGSATRAASALCFDRRTGVYGATPLTQADRLL